MTLLDQPLGQALLALDLVVIAADDRPQRGRGPHRGLSVDIGRQAILFRDLAHRPRMFRWRSGGVKGYSPAHAAFRLRRIPCPTIPSGSIRCCSSVAISISSSTSTSSGTTSSGAA